MKGSKRQFCWFWKRQLFKENDKICSCMLPITGQNLSCTQVLSNDSFFVKIINTPTEEKNISSRCRRFGKGSLKFIKLCLHYLTRMKATFDYRTNHILKFTSIKDIIFLSNQLSINFLLVCIWDLTSPLTAVNYSGNQSIKINLEDKIICTSETRSSFSVQT